MNYPAASGRGITKDEISLITSRGGVINSFIPIRCSARLPRAGGTIGLSTCRQTGVQLIIFTAPALSGIIKIQFHE